MIFRHAESQIEEALANALTEFSRGATLQSIQRDTAIVWAGRALAAYQLYSDTRNLRQLLDAEEFAHESLEHAALAEDFELLRYLDQTLKAYKVYALA